MKPMIFNVQLPVEDTLERMKQGTHFKFVPALYVDLDTEEIVLVVVMGKLTLEHADLYGMLTSTVNSVEEVYGSQIFAVEDDALSGGRVKIDDNKLVFFDESIRYGKFDKGLLQKVPQEQFCKCFNVKEVVFE